MPKTRIWPKDKYYTRLVHMIRVLQEVENTEELLRNFDMEYWCEIEPEYFEHCCEYAACALGHVGLDPWFRHRGLKTKPSEGSVEYGKSDNVLRYQLFPPEGTYAAEDFFDLDCDEARSIFESSSYSARRVKPKHVIDRVKRLIRKRYGEDNPIIPKLGASYGKRYKVVSTSS